MSPTYTKFKDPSLWMAIQVPDKKVGMKVDWDPYIAFFEFVQRRHLFYSLPTHEYQGSMQTQTTSGSTLRLAAQFGITQSPISRVRERARARMLVCMSCIYIHFSGAPKETPSGKRKQSKTKGTTRRFPKSTAEENLCAQVWLFIDAKMRLALQDNFQPQEMAAAVMAHCQRHTRRLDLRMFQAGARNLSLGLDLRLSEANIKDLFVQADTDRDGYITFLDALRALRLPVGRWEKLKRQEWHLNGSLPLEVQRTNQERNAGILSLTWLQIAQRVQARQASLGYGTASDVHHIVDNKIRAAFPEFEVASRRRALQFSCQRCQRGAVCSHRMPFWGKLEEAQKHG